jgi:hypothetical protein
MIVPDKLAETLDRVINRCGAGISFLKTSVQVRAKTGLINAATLGCRGLVPYADHNRLAVQDRHSLPPVRRRVSSTTPVSVGGENLFRAASRAFVGAELDFC